MSSEAGRIRALYRFPVKSLQGETLDAVEVSSVCVLGDRGYALVDAATGKKLSAKRHPELFSMKARFAAPPQDPLALPPVIITLPDGAEVRSDSPEAASAISRALGCEVEIRPCAPQPPTPDALLPGESFFDGAPVHLLTTATLEYLRQANPAADFDPLRFRPNVLVDVPDTPCFAEDRWIGAEVAIGEVRLRVAEACPRCAMTTWAQPGLPHDPTVLKTAVAENNANVGVYLEVLTPGTLRVGDPVRLLEARP